MLTMPFFEDEDDTVWKKLHTILIYVGVVVVAFFVNLWSGFLTF